MAYNYGEYVRVPPGNLFLLGCRQMLEGAMDNAVQDASREFWRWALAQPGNELRAGFALPLDPQSRSAVTR